MSKENRSTPQALCTTQQHFADDKIGGPLFAVCPGVPLSIAAEYLQALIVNTSAAAACANHAETDTMSLNAHEAIITLLSLANALASSSHRAAHSAERA